MSATVLIASISCLAAGVLIGWLLVSRRSAALQSQLDRTSSERDSAVRERERVEKDVRELREQLAKVQRAQAEVETRLEEARKMERFLEESKAQLASTYSQLSQQALKEAIENLQQLVKPELQKTTGEISSSLDKKKIEIDAMLQPVREMLEKYRQEIQSSEKSRMSAYGGLQEQIQQMMGAYQTLQAETSRLNTALESPTIQGSWGENTLRRVVELAGMSEYCDFDIQMTFENEDGERFRPDMVVNLPDDRVIAVDSKVPLDAYKRAASETEEKRRKEWLDKHAQNVRRHIDLLSRKEYQENVGQQLRKSLDFTILFVGGEHFLSSAMVTDQSIWDYATSKKIVLASPTILVPLLQALGTGWKAEKVEENAQKALAVAAELYDRFCRFCELLEGVGKGLDSAVGRYNEAIGSFDHRLEPTGRKLQELVDSRRKLPDVSKVQKGIFESQKLKEIAAASQDLSEIDSEN